MGRVMRIKVAHMDISVRAMTPNDKQWEGDDAAWGLFYVMPAEIAIHPHRPASDQARILIHELLHAVFHVHTKEDRRRDEETVCGLLDVPLACLLKDNPWLPGVLNAALNEGKPIVT